MLLFIYRYMYIYFVVISLHFYLTEKQEEEHFTRITVASGEYLELPVVDLQ